MWFFGFSTTNPKSIWIFIVILIVIFVTIIIRRWAVHPESSEGGGAASNSSKSAAQGTDNRDKYCREKCKNNASCNCCPSTGVIRTYALEELKLATRDFRIRIGVGATSYVYLAERGDGRFGAVKRVMEERGGSKTIFLDEVSVLLRISHPNLVGLLGFCLEKGEQLLLLEYVPNKSLFDRLHTRYGQSYGVLSWSNRLSIAIDIAEALNYLHSTADPPVIHRDIKSSNILLIDDNHAKLADFGLCKLGHDSTAARTPTTIRGSLGYVDANYLATGCVSPKSDVYSFGVFLLELVTGLKSLQGSATLAEWTEEARKRGDLEALVDPKLRGEANAEQLRVVMDVANLALLENSEARPDMGQVLDCISRCYTEPQISPELPV